MRYNHESYLPIGAFQPILGRMRLHGGGGNPLDTFSDMIGTGGGDTGLFNMVDEGFQGVSDVFAGADDLIFQPVTAPISQVTSALDDAVVQPITAPISEVGVAIDDAVADVIPGGWGTIAQVAAAATGNPYIIGATSAGVNFAKNKDLKKAVEAGAISGGTAGITQGLGDVFQLGDIGKAALSGGIKGGVNYAKTGDVNSALKSGAEGAAMSYGGAKLGEFTAPYLNELKGDFGKYLQDNGFNLSGSADPTVNVEGAVTSAVPDPAMGQPYNPDPMQDLINSKLAESSQADFQDRSPYNYPTFEEGFEPTAGYDPKANLLDNPYKYLEQKGTDAKEYLDKAGNYLKDTPLSEMPGDLYDAAKDYYNNASKTDLAMLAAGAYGLSSLGGGGGDSKGKSQAQIDAEEAAAKKTYTYGTAGQMPSNYLLKNRINADNVYSSATGYRPLTRYAEGGEVQHFGIGGKISDAFTRVAQPFEKAIIRPIGEAAPFLKDLAPYAGMAAGAMMGNPAMAAGIGGIASGFGKPGGFDMKRALMGGIAAYGMSNLAGGLEAAGAETALPPVDSASTVPDYYQAMKTANTPYTAEEVDRLIKPPTISRGTGVAPRDMFSLRDTDAMQRGVGNLLQNSNTPAYKDAMNALTSKVGIYNTGVPLVMGTTGMMGVDESNALKKDYDQATAQSQADEDKFKARVAAGKKRAQQAVSENPYMFAEGGAINPPDDQTQLANETPMTKLNEQAQMQMASPLQGLGAENQMMSQSAGLGNTLNGVTTNNGISGLFSQLTTNPSNNASPYTPQGGTPESVILPSYGGSGGPNGMGGSPSMSGGGSGGSGGASGAFPLQGQYGIVKMAAGGMAPPRFLSGGGDGMSDSIRANIEGTQEARLADGEFVIPADVVSHLGNGSSKAGAKQLYDMMNRVRKARTGNPKQGREIKPTKLMPV